MKLLMNLEKGSGKITSSLKWNNELAMMTEHRKMRKGACEAVNILNIRNRSIVYQGGTFEQIKIGSYIQSKQRY